ncbi:MAG: homoserine dehydrogenase [Eubacteriales bacterium]|nr:homoserine dehydrogenase [Eubacteriales bacterium]
MISVALMGHGVVGSGVAEILTTHKQKLFSSVGEEIYLKHILDLRDFPDSPLCDRFTKNFEEIVNDKEVRVVIETMGGINPAYDFTKRCLSLGKSVVTSNKELVARHGAELLQIAKENNANYLFEASVGGGIPILRPIDQCLVANNVDEIAGILNGTTNFILTKMITENMAFDAALKLAQDLGYAERNPEADVEGHDACRKICILASLAFGKHVYPDNVHTEGITKITLEDVEYAASWGGVIKLIGSCKPLGNGMMDIVVAPMFVPCTSQLANINDVFNGIMVRGDCTGDVVFYGKGAGKLPTASAVVADTVDCCKHLKARKRLFWVDSKENNIADYKLSKTKVYVRALTDDISSAYTMVQDIFGAASRLERANAPRGEFAFVTEEALPYGEIMEGIKALERLDIEILSTIRIGNL